MNPKVIGLMANQHGLIRRQQALELGLHAHEIERLIATGQWIAVRRGVYATRAAWDELDIWAEQPRLRALAASLNMRLDHVLSHDSAADLHGLPILRANPDLIHVTRPDVGGSRTRSGVKHHGAVFRDDQVTWVDGVPVLDLARTAVDIAREHGVLHGVPACDAALRRGVTRAQLRLAAEPMCSWPGKRSVDTSIELADPGAENVAESLARMVVLESGIGFPETQFELRDGERWARCDLRVDRHLVEMDGRKKYLARSEGGVADDPVHAVWDEKERQDWLHRHRLGMTRLVWQDLWGVRRQRTINRIVRDHATTCRMFGTDLDDLSHLIIRQRAC